MLQQMLVQHESTFQVLMDLSFDFLLLASSLQFHENVKLSEAFHHLAKRSIKQYFQLNVTDSRKIRMKDQVEAADLCLSVNDLKKFIGKQGVRPLLD
jgi:hypothetical protein